MNYKTWLLPFVSFLASICCQARSIQHPSYLLGSPGLSNSKLERIEIGKKTTALIGAPDKPCGVGRADANPKLLLNDA